MPDAIGAGTDDDDAERERRDLLLELDSTVHRDQNIIVAPHAAQEFTILNAGPTAPGHGLDRMAAELRSEIYRQLLVKKDAHRPRAIGVLNLVQRRLGRAAQTGIGAEIHQASRRLPSNQIAI